MFLANRTLIMDKRCRPNLTRKHYVKCYIMLSHAIHGWSWQALYHYLTKFDTKVRVIECPCCPTLFTVGNVKRYTMS